MATIYFPEKYENVGAYFVLMASVWSNSWQDEVMRKSSQVASWVALLRNFSTQKILAGQYRDSTNNVDFGGNKILANEGSV